MIQIWKVFGGLLSVEEEQIPPRDEVSCIMNFCQKDIWHKGEEGLAVKFYIK